MKLTVLVPLTMLALLVVSCGPPSSNGTPYPLDTCLVTGKPLGSMGDPYVFVYESQELKLCCKSCLKHFQGDPDAYLLKLLPALKLPDDRSQ